MTELLSNADALAPKGAALTMAGKKTAPLAAAGLDGAVATGVTAAGAAAAGAAPTIPMTPVRDQPNEHGGALVLWPPAMPNGSTAAAPMDLAGAVSN